MKKLINIFMCFLFGDNKRIEPTGFVYRMWEYNTWGNNIEFIDFDKRRISGHYLNPFRLEKFRLQVGDELRCDMNSGKVGRFIISKIEYCMDPKDQFFGTVEDIGYLE